MTGGNACVDVREGRKRCLFKLKEFAIKSGRGKSQALAGLSMIGWCCAAKGMPVGSKTFRTHSAVLIFESQRHARSGKFDLMYTVAPQRARQCWYAGAKV
jgi:hypothetical protein